MYVPLEDPKFTLTLVSPSIKYQNSYSSYKYPINAHVASLLVIDIEEVLYKYKSGINKLEIIINKSLSNESKRTEKSLTMINERK